MLIGCMVNRDLESLWVAQKPHWEWPKLATIYLFLLMLKKEKRNSIFEVIGTLIV